jgi:hypothetical protein
VTIAATGVPGHHGDTIGQATPAAPVTAFKIPAPDKITLSFAR